MKYKNTNIAPEAATFNSNKNVLISPIAYGPDTSVSSEPIIKHIVIIYLT